MTEQQNLAPKAGNYDRTITESEGQSGWQKCQPFGLA